MAEIFTNDATTTLAAGMGTGDNTLTVVSGSQFPASGNFRIRIDNEVMTVTGVSGVVWTVTRASEKVSGVQVAAVHTIGAFVAGVVTAGSLGTISTGAGQGTVTSFGFNNANGVSGSVTNSATTPVLTVTLGAITPSSVVASGNISAGGTISATGNISGGNLSGTNTGDQTITLTGDVTGSGTGSFAVTIANQAVTYAKMQQAQANRLLGNPSGSTGAIQEISLGAGLQFTGGTLAATGSGSGSVTNVSVVSAAGISGSVANPTTTPAITITVGNGAITNAMLAGSITASNLVGTDIATVGTITSGVWNGTRLTSTYIPTDVAYVDVSNTFTGVTQTFQPVAQSSGNATNFLFTGAADTNLTASTERVDVNWNLNRSVGFAAGALAMQRSFIIQPPTYTFASASTINTAVTFEVTGVPIAGSGAAITQAVAARFKTGIASGKGVIIAATAAQTNNLLEFQDSSGNTLANFNATGRLGIGGSAQGLTTTTYGFIVKTGTADERVQITGSTSSGFYLTNAGVTDGATVRYDATNGYEHFVSNSLEVMQFTITNGLCGVGNATRNGGGAPTAQLHVWGNASGNVVAKVQGASGQSVDLQDWINNGGTTLSSVLSTGDITTQSAGVGFRVKEGTNAKMGTAVLSGGTKVVSTTAVNANSRIFLTNATGTTNAGVLTVSSISAGVSFTITSTNGSDANTVNWLILDPS